MKCKIYKIISENTPFVYIGSTRKKLETRLNGHIRDYKHRIDYYNWFYDYSHNFEFIPNKFKNEPVNISSYKILMYHEFNIELLEEFDYEDKSDIFKREQFYINLYKNICVNTANPWPSFTYKYKHGNYEKKLKVDALENYFCKNCNNIGHDTSWINCCKNFNNYNYNNYTKLLEDIRHFKCSKV
tara:strand:+ start:49 stop:603 length:555 start_codon:yes stop_codon:yes gene_type:complete